MEEKHISINKPAAAMALITIGLVSLHLYRTATLKTRNKALTVKEDETGIITTDRMTEVLDLEIKKAKRYSRPLSVAIVRFDDASGSGIFDAEHFAKAIKNSFGTLRSSDFVGRWGRNELLVVFTETDIKGAALAFERIYSLIAAYIEKHELTTEIYFGMSEFSRTDDMNTLLSRADTVLFMSKDSANS
jgi:diguanylate cyclase (GGDEF)-like protein